LTNGYSPTWFETFGRPDEAQTAAEVGALLELLLPPPASVLDVPCDELEATFDAVICMWDGTRDELEWRLYEPDELRALGTSCGLRLVSPSTRGESPRALHVFRRDT